MAVLGYSYAEIDDPLATTGTWVDGINDAGQIVGYYRLGPFQGVHGFLYNGTTYTPIDVPFLFVNATFLFGINDLGQIVGQYNLDDGTSHGFLFSGGTYTTIDDPLSDGETSAEAINNDGQIVGSYTSGGYWHGFLFSGGTYTTLDDPLATGSTFASGINDKGEIVGEYDDGTGAHGFLFIDGTYVTLDYPEALSTAAEGINNAEEIVGYYQDSNSVYHIFQYEGGVYTTIDPATPLDGYVVIPHAVNDAGNIVGSTAFAANGTGSGFLATPNEIDATAPILLSSTPANNASDVAVGSAILLTFDEAVQPGTGGIAIYRSSDDSLFETIPIGDSSQVTFSGNTVTINPTIELAAGTSYYVAINPGVIQDLFGNSYAGLPFTSSLDFRTAVPVATTVLPISAFPEPSQLATGIPPFLAGYAASLSVQVLNFLEPALNWSGLKTGATVIGDIASTTGQELNDAAAVLGIFQGGGTLTDANAPSVEKLLAFDGLGLTVATKNAPQSYQTDVEIASIGLSLLDGTPVEKLLTIDGFILNTVLAGAANNFAEDPPDPNYTTVYTPPIPTLALPANGVDASLIGVLNQSIAQSLELAALLAGANTSFNRYSSALQAGDASSALLQMEAITSYLRSYASTAQSAGTTLSLLQSAISPQIGGAIDTGALADLSSIVSQQGLDPTVVSFLNQIGLNQDEISSVQSDEATLQVPESTLSAALSNAASSFVASASEILSMTDPGPSVTPQTPSVVEMNQTTVIGKVSPGISGDTLTLTQTSTSLGSLSLGPVQGDGTQQVIYAAPAMANASVSVAISYTVTDEYKIIAAPGAGTVQLDAGPSVTPQTPSVVEMNQTTVIGKVSPGISGDTLTLTQTSTSLGSLSLGPVQADGTQQVIYAAPAIVKANAVDKVAYTVVDQHNDVVASGSANVQLEGPAPPDPGPSVTLLPVAHSEFNKAATVATATPGLPSDTLSLVVLQAPQSGKLTLQGTSVQFTSASNDLGSLLKPITFSFEIKDQLGDITTPSTVDIGGDIASNIAGSTTGNTNISLGSGLNRVTLAGGGNMIDAGSGANVVTGGTGNNTVILGNGIDSVTLGGSNNKVTLGSGLDSVKLSGGGNIVTIGNGASTVSVDGSGNRIKLGNGIDVVHGGTGDTITLTGNNGSLSLYGRGEMLFLGGSGESINDLSQGLKLVLSGNVGAVKLSDFFKDLTGVIDLRGGLGGFTTPQGVVAALQNDHHGGTLLSFGQGSSLDLSGVAMSQLHSSNFQIG
jgi:probable HAF family extracellular repeat protein